MQWLFGQARAHSLDVALALHILQSLEEPLDAHPGCGQDGPGPMPSMPLSRDAAEMGRGHTQNTERAREQR